jgi:phenylacetate-CoA ligase
MRWSLNHAYDNVPHYRKRFDDAKVKPSDLKTLADLAKFPFTLKKDLRDNYPFGLFAVPREKVVRFMRRAEPPASRRWSATPRRTSTPGPR